MTQLTIKGASYVGNAQAMLPTLRCGWFPNRTLPDTLGFRTFRPSRTTRTRVVP